MKASVYSPRDSRNSRLLYIAFVCLVSALCFGSLRHHEIYFHDDETFRDNVAISEDFSFFFSSSKEQFTGRPVAEFVKWIAFSAVGNSPPACHLIVVAFHTLASLLLALLFRRLGLNLELAYLGGVLFLVDVSHFHSLHHISAIDYPLGLVFGVLGVLSYLRYSATSDSLWMVATYAALIAAVATHLAMVMAWPFLLYLSWLRFGSRAWHLHLPLGTVLTLLSAYLLSITPGDTTTGVSISYYTTEGIPAAFASFCRMMAWFTSRLFTTAHWLPMPLYEVQPWEFYLGALTLAAIAVLTWHRHAILAVWGGWLVVFLMPFALISEKMSIGAMEGASHYLYLASAGSSLILAWTLQQIGLWLRSRLKLWGVSMYGAATLVLLCSSYVALKRVEAFSYYNSGRYLISRDVDTAVEYLALALEHGQEVLELHEAYRRLAIAIPLVGGDPLPVLREGLALFPHSYVLNSAMGVVELESDDDEAQKRGERRLAATLTRAEQTGHERRFAKAVTATYNNLSIGLVAKGDYVRAIRFYKQALPYTLDREKTLAGMADASVALGNALAGENRLDGAFQMYHAAVQVAPNHTPAQINLGWQYHLKGQFDDAIEQYQAVLAREANIHARFNLGLAFLAKGDVAQAEATYAAAVAEFGAAEAQAIGAVEELYRLMDTDIRTAAHRIAQTYWPNGQH